MRGAQVDGLGDADPPAVPKPGVGCAVVVDEAYALVPAERPTDVEFAEPLPPMTTTKSAPPLLATPALEPDRKRRQA